MKNRKFILILAAEAVLCVAAALALKLQGGSAYVTIAQFPFAEVGLLLRSLSLSGTVGNVAAIVLYAMLCTVPLAVVALRIKKRALKAEDALLVIMSGFGFYMMYMMVNPGILSRIPCYAVGDSGKAVLGGTFYSLLIGYLVLRLLRHAGGSGTDKLLRVMRLLFAIVALVLVFSVAYIGVSDVRSELAAIKAANTDPSVSLGLTTFFVVLRFVLTQSPVVMELGIFLLGMRLCEALREDRYGEVAIDAARKLASFAKIMVVVILLCCITRNLAQVVFAGSLISVDFLATLPLSEIVVAVGALLLTRFFVASRELKQDNQMII
jgi:hypothetical protein